MTEDLTKHPIARHFSVGVWGDPATNTAQSWNFRTDPIDNVSLFEAVAARGGSLGTYNWRGTVRAFRPIFQEFEHVAFGRENGDIVMYVMLPADLQPFDRDSLTQRVERARYEASSETEVTFVDEDPRHLRIHWNGGAFMSRL